RAAAEGGDLQVGALVRAAAPGPVADVANLAAAVEQAARRNRGVGAGGQRHGQDAAGGAFGLRTIPADPGGLDLLLARLLLERALFRRGHHGLERRRVGMIGPGLPADSDDPNRVERVALANREHHVEALHHLAKYGEVAIEIAAIAERDAPLRAVGSRSAIGHVDRARVVVAQAFVNFVGEIVSRASGAGGVRNASLNDVAGDDAMEGRVVEKRLAGVERGVRDGALGQADEVGDGNRGVLGLELNYDQALAGLHV